jgi:hypothetical protein
MSVEELGRGCMQTTKRTERALAETLTPECKPQLSECLAQDLDRIPWSSLPMSWQETCGLGKNI